MQEPTAFVKPHFPEQEQLKCPRCDSSNTKFCYYNNYNLSQPRHFCKNCRRYWTKGGALRNIPVGGGTRKNTTTKRPSSAVKRSPPPPPASTDPDPDPTPVQQPSPIGSLGFSSLMAASTGHWGDLLEGLNPNGPGLKMIRLGGFGENSNSGRNPDAEKQSHGDSSFWNGGSSSTNGWSDLAIYTPGSSFQ